MMASVVHHVNHASIGYNYGVPSSSEPREGNSHKTPPRRKVKNGNNRIKVCVRKRPLSKKEARRDEDVVQVETNQRRILVKEDKLAVDLRKITLVHKFQFDDVFSEDCSNKAVYEKTIKMFLPFVLNGGKATCFAFGQTGAGKTHTLLGDTNGKGLYQFAAEDLFELLKQEKPCDGLVVWISYFEVYCGQLYDLLNKRERIQALENDKHQVCIAGVNEVPVKGSQALIWYVEHGNGVRRQGSSGVNSTSSRSHAVLQIQLKDVSGNKVGRLSVIDLAGSERACDRGDPDKATRLEGAEINTSLLSLKECIRAMDQDQPHTPFRQSKLTQVLKDSLLGESQTCMLASISPASSSLEDTLNTLRYATRVKEINKLRANSGYTPKAFSPNTTSTPLKAERGGFSPSTTTRRTTLSAQRPSKVTPVIDPQKRSSVQQTSSNSLDGGTSRVRPGSSRTPQRITRKASRENGTLGKLYQAGKENDHGKRGLEMSPVILREIIDGDTSVIRDKMIGADVSLETQKKSLINHSVRNERQKGTDIRLKSDFHTTFVGLQKQKMVRDFLSNSLPVWENEEVERTPHPIPNLSFLWEVENPHYIKRQEKGKEENRRELLEKSNTSEVFDYGNPRYVGRKGDSQISFYRDEAQNSELNNSGCYAKKAFQTLRNEFSGTVQSLINDDEEHLEEERDGAGSPNSVATDGTMELLAEINQSLRNSFVSPFADLGMPFSLEGISYTEPWKREHSTSGVRPRVSNQRETSLLSEKQINFREETGMTDGNSRKSNNRESELDRSGSKGITESLGNEGSSEQIGRKINDQRGSEIFHQVTHEGDIIVRGGGPHTTDEWAREVKQSLNDCNKTENDTEIARWIYSPDLQVNEKVPTKKFPGKTSPPMTREISDNEQGINDIITEESRDADEQRLDDHKADMSDHGRITSLQVAHDSSVKRRHLRQRTSLPWLGAPRFDDYEESVCTEIQEEQSTDTTNQQSERFVSSAMFEINDRVIDRISMDAGVQQEEMSQRFGSVTTNNKPPSGDDPAGGGDELSKNQTIQSIEDSKQNKSKTLNVESSNPIEGVREITNTTSMKSSSKPAASSDASISLSGDYISTVYSPAQFLRHQNSAINVAHEDKKETIKKSLKDKRIESLPASAARFLEKSGMLKRRDGDVEREGIDQRYKTTRAETAQSRRMKEDYHLGDADRGDSDTEGGATTPKKNAFFRETFQPVSNKWQHVTIDGRSPVSKVKLITSANHESQGDRSCYYDGGIEYSDNANEPKYLECKNQNSFDKQQVVITEQGRALNDDVEGDTRQRRLHITHTDGRMEKVCESKRQEGLIEDEERIQHREEIETVGQQSLETIGGIPLINRADEAKIEGEREFQTSIIRTQTGDDMELVNRNNTSNIGRREMVLETESITSQNYETYKVCDEQSMRENTDIDDIKLNVDTGEERSLLSPIPEGRIEEEACEEKRDDARPKSALEKATSSTDGAPLACITSHLLVRAHQDQLEELQQLCDNGWSLINRFKLGEGDMYGYLTDSNVLIERQQRCIATYQDQLTMYTHCSTPDISLNLEEPGIS